MSAVSILNWHVNISLPVYFCVIRFRVDVGWLPCICIYMKQPIWVASTYFGRIFGQYGSVDDEGLIINRGGETKKNQALCFAADLIIEGSAHNGP